MGRLYKNAPVIEALCEFKFQPDSKWDYTIPGLIYEKVKAQFPERKQENLLAFEFEPKEKGIHQRVKGPGIKMQFRRADGKALVQVAPNLLAVNQLQPYPTWPEFKKMILEAYSIYIELAQPNAIERIGLRYINQIDLPERSFDLERFLQVYPNFPKGYPENYGNLLLRAEFPYEEEQEVLVLILASAPPSEGIFSRLILDLDYGMPKVSGMALKEIDERLERAHIRIEQVFEASITDETRRLLGVQEI